MSKWARLVGSTRQLTRPLKKKTGLVGISNLPTRYGPTRLACQTSGSKAGQPALTRQPVLFYI